MSPSNAPKIRRHLTLTMDRELADLVYAYHQSAGINASVQDAVRELVRLGLSADPEPTVTALTRRRVFKETSMFVLRRLSTFLHEVANEVDATAQLMPMEGPFDGA